MARLIAIGFVLLLEGAQITLASTIVIGVSPNRIVVAADSRRTIVGSGRHDDDECKISVLRNQLVFIATGVFEERASDGSLIWNSYDVFQKISDAASTTSFLVDEVPNIWGTAMASILELAAARVTNWNSSDGVISQGIFAGIGRTGELIFKLIKFTYEPALPRKINAVVYGIDPGGRHEAEMSYGVFGTVTVANEFLHRTSPRADLEAASWGSQMSDTSEHEEQWRKATRLVDLAIAYEPGAEVGGDIDVVELTATGTQWLQRKAQCQGR